MAAALDLFLNKIVLLSKKKKKKNLDYIVSNFCVRLRGFFLVNKTNYIFVKWIFDLSLSISLSLSLSLNIYIHILYIKGFPSFN